MGSNFIGSAILENFIIMFRSRLRPHIARKVYIVDGRRAWSINWYSVPTTPRFALGMADEFRSFVSGNSIHIVQDKPYAIVDAVLKSELLAQITANDQNDAATDYEGWCRSYEKVLTGIGWMTDQFSFRKFSADKEMVTVASMMKQVIGSMRGLSAELFSGYNSAITALNEKEGNSALLDNLLSNCATMMETEGRSITHYSVHVSLAYQDSEESMTMILGLFRFSLDEYTKNWLLIEVKSSEIEMLVCVQKSVLNLAIWDQVKDGITEKLRQNAREEILKMEFT